MPRLASMTSQALTGAGRSFSATYSVTPAADNVDEGSTLTINVATTNVPNGTTLYYTLSSSLDFLPNANGSFSINSNSGSFDITPNEDNSTEGPDNTQVMIRTGSIDGPIVVTSSIITINDTSTSLPTYNAVPAANNVDEGSALTINVTTTLVADATTLYYTLTNSGDFVTSSGSFTIASNSGSFTVTPTADLTTEGAETFQVQIRTDSTSGTIVDTSNNITINDTSLVPTLAYTLDDPNAYGSSAGDAFGFKVAISGNNAIVTAPYEDDTGGVSQTGRAYIFNVSTGALVHTLDDPNAYGSNDFDNFGEAVAISGNNAIVGARSEDDAGGGSSGKAYIYNVSTGALVHTLDNPNPYGSSVNDIFGWSVAIDGNSVIVGASGEDDAGGNSSGKAYIFNASTGNLLHTLDNPNAYDTSASDFFGNSVAISGDRAIVGADREDDAGGTSSGKAYIFNVSTGALVHTLDNPNAYSTSASDQFSSSSVAISGDRAIVGAYREDDTGGTSSGKAYIFNVTTGNLVHTLDNPNAYSTSASDQFGFSVAISGNYAIVGANFEDDAGGSKSGKAYIFNVTTGALLQTLDNPTAYDISDRDEFGYSVSITDNYAIVSAYREDDAGGSNSGKAYVYNLSTDLTYNAVPAANNVNEGSALTINVTTTNVADATTLYYTLTNAGDFATSSGSFTIASNAGSFTVTPTADATAEGAETFQVQIRTGSTSGTIVATSDLITINDTSIPPISWDRQVTMSNPNIDTGSSSDRFGFGNAITDTYIIIGADLEDTGGNNAQGVVYVYEIVDESTITLRHTLTNPNSTGTAQFWGQRLDAQGDYLVVGDSTGNRVQVYQFSNMSGTTISSADYTITESTASSNFADSVAIDSGWIVVGDPGVNSSNGCAYVYNTGTFSGSNITSPAHVLQNPYTNTGTADRMGQSIDIHKDQIVISMSGYNETANSQGRIMLYDKSNFTTTNISSPDAFYDSPEDQVYFGGPQHSMVAINQDAGLAAVCHQFYDAGAGVLQGRVYVTDTSGNLERILESPDAGADDRFGTTCVFTPNGDQLIVTMQNSSDATYVYNTSTILAGLPSAPLTSADYKKLSGNFAPNSVSANDTRFVVGSQTNTTLPQVFYKFQ